MTVTYVFWTASNFRKGVILGHVIRVVDLESHALTAVGLNPTRDFDSFMWGTYLASLWNVGGSTQVPALDWNNAGRGTWSLLPPMKLQSQHITFTVLVWRKNPTQKKLDSYKLYWSADIFFVERDVILFNFLCF